MQPRGARDGVRDGRGSVRQRFGVSVAAAATLGLALGAATTLMAVRSAVLGSPLPYDEGDRLALVWNRLPEAGYDRLPLSDAEWSDHERELSSAGLVDAAAAFVIDRATLVGVGPPRALSVVRAEPGLLAMLSEGQAAVAQDFRGGDACVVSHRAWRQLFESDAQLVGSRIEVDGRSVRVVGVLPETVAFPPPITWQGRTTGDGLGADIFLPLAVDTGRPRSDRRLMGLVRRSEVAGVGKISRWLEESALALAETHPREHPPGLSTTSVALREQSVELVRPTLRTLTLAVALVLLVACVNVSLLLLARSVERRGETAIRAALGARRRHLVRDVLAESLGLAAAGGLVSLAVAAGSWWVLRRTTLPGLPGLARVELDVGLALSVLLLVVVCGLATGCAPAWRTLRGELSCDLKASRLSTGPGLRRLQAGLVVFELALAVMLLAVSAALVKDFVDLARTGAGFRTEGVAHVDLHLGKAGDRAVLATVMDEIRALPNVESVAASTSPPLSAGLEASAYHVDFGGFIVSSGPDLVTIHRVTPDYFRVLDLPIQGGDPPPGGVVVSSDLARRVVGGSEAVVGARLTFDDPRSAEAVWHPIHGVVGARGDRSTVRKGVGAAVYLPIAGAALPERVSLLVAGPARTGGNLEGEPESAADLPLGPLREAIWRSAPTVPVNIERLESRVEAARQQPRLAAGLLASFAALASLLAALGVHGVLAFQVARRVREMALRQALGATLHDVRRLILRQALRWAALGSGVGLLLSWLIGRLLRSLLPGFDYGVAHLGWVLLAALLVLPLAQLAARLPSGRAVAVDPVVGLRVDG